MRRILHARHKNNFDFKRRRPSPARHIPPILLVHAAAFLCCTGAACCRSSTAAADAARLLLHPQCSAVLPCIHFVALVLHAVIAALLVCTLTIACRRCFATLLLASFTVLNGTECCHSASRLLHPSVMHGCCMSLLRS